MRLHDVKLGADRFIKDGVNASDALVFEAWCLPPVESLRGLVAHHAGAAR